MFILLFSDYELIIQKKRAIQKDRSVLNRENLYYF
jgi:hypothetical protein